MRNRTAHPKKLGAVTSCAGLMTRLAYAHAQAAHIDLPPLLQCAGLSMHDIEDDNVRIRVSAQIDFLNLLAQALNDRLLGFHLGLQMDLRRAGFIYYAAASSDTLGDALRDVARYSTIINEGVTLEIETGETLRIAFGYAGVSRQSDRHQIEAWTTAVMRCCREITGRAIVPTDVRIMHQRIPESAELDSFFGRTVDFGADKDETLLSGDAAKLPVVNADPHLKRLLTQHFESVLARRKMRAGALQADVENLIATLLPHGQTRIETVAQKLGFSPRTLRRKLAAEGATFGGILEDLRFVLAKDYLAQHDLPISRIAWLLGYTEVSAFSHAFRRWSGRTPRADRSRRLRADLTDVLRRMGR